MTFAIFSISACGDNSDDTAVPAAIKQGSVYHFTLENGLRITVKSVHTAPTVSVELLYHVGARHEVRGKTGIAHLFEHIMTNGSENHPSSFMDAYRKIGATHVNATTNMDRTNYFVTAPARA